MPENSLDIKVTFRGISWKSDNRKDNFEGSPRTFWDRPRTYIVYVTDSCTKYIQSYPFRQFLFLHCSIYGPFRWLNFLLKRSKYVQSNISRIQTFFWTPTYNVNLFSNVSLQIWASSWVYGSYHIWRPAKAQASLRIRAVSREPSLFARTQ